MDDALAPLQRALGVRFADPALLRLSLTHTSYVNERPDVAPVSNERLEYLGDAFIGLVTARKLYADHPHMDEGALTEARASVVRGESLAACARALGLGEGLLLGQGEEQTGGREKPGNLACALEAVIGAVYLDQGAVAAEAVALRVLQPYLDDAGRRQGSQDPKSRLQEAAQARGLGLPAYRLLSETGPGHQRTFTVEVVVAGKPLAQGSGPRKVEAERQAARAAVTIITGEDPDADEPTAAAQSPSSPAAEGHAGAVAVAGGGGPPGGDAAAGADAVTAPDGADDDEAGAIVQRAHDRPQRAYVRSRGGSRLAAALRPLVIATGWGIGALGLAAALLGAVRFFLAAGASPAYLWRRKRWYESTVLGRPMGLRGLLHFGRWAAEQGRSRHWP